MPNFQAMDRSQQEQILRLKNLILASDVLIMMGQQMTTRNKFLALKYDFTF